MKKLLIANTGKTMKQKVTLLCLTAALAMTAFVASAYEANWRWKCDNSNCNSGKKWGDAFPSREEATRVGKLHEQAKNHRISVKLD